MQRPFGTRYLVSPEPARETVPMTYSEQLQLNVGASGNPWHAETQYMNETKTETSHGDGSRPGSDDGTDTY